MCSVFFLLVVCSLFTSSSSSPSFSLSKSASFKNSSLYLGYRSWLNHMQTPSSSSSSSPSFPPSKSTSFKNSSQYLGYGGESQVLFNHVILRQIPSSIIEILSKSSSQVSNSSTNATSHRSHPVIAKIFLGSLGEIVVTGLAVALFMFSIQRREKKKLSWIPINNLRLSSIKSAIKVADQSLIMDGNFNSRIYHANLKGYGDVGITRFRKPNQSIILNNFSVGCATQNMVQFHGYYCDKDLYLVHEWMPLGSLDRLLLRQTGGLTFDRRLRILLQISACIEYLHEDSGTPISHKDIATSNIMVDADFNAKLCDPGLTEIFNKIDIKFPTCRIGYYSPEYLFSGVSSPKTDVYSFGMVVLEVATGRLVVNEPVKEWVWKFWEKNNLVATADPKMMGMFVKNDFERIVMTGLICMHSNWRKRPTIKDAGRMLRGEVLPDLPDKMPIVSIESLIP
ncbi:hypothetical protein Lser_V15G42979 [Lactuca serriola]